MKIDQHFPCGTFAGNFFVEIYHPLIVALHKVNFNPFYSPCFKLIECFLQFVVERFPGNPKNNVNIFFFSVVNQFFYINVFFLLHNIRKYVPAFVKNNVLQSVFRCKIDVVFIGRVIYAGHKINTVNVVGVPPVPGYFSGFNPVGIFEFALGRQFINHFGFNQLTIVFGNYHSTPRKIAWSVTFGNVIGIFCRFYIAVAQLLGFQYNTRVFPNQCILIIVATTQKHSRIIHQVRFRNVGFNTVAAVNQQACRGKTIAANIR